MGMNHRDDGSINNTGSSSSMVMMTTAMMEIPQPPASSNNHTSTAQAMECLTEMEKNMLIAEGKQIYSDMFHFVRFAQTTSSSTKYATKISSSFRGDNPKTTTNSKKKKKFNSKIMVCFSTKVVGSLEEVASLFTRDDSKMIFDFHKSKTISHLLSPTQEKPFLAASLRWSIWEAPSKLVKDRDFCYLEYMDEFMDDCGKRGWARAVRSIDHNSCPPFETPNGPIRGEVNCSAIVAKESAVNGVLDVQTVLQVDTHGIPSKLAEVVVKARVKNIMNINHVLMIARKQQQTIQSYRFSSSSSRFFSTSEKRGITSSYHGFTSAPAPNKNNCRCCRLHISRWSKTRRCRVCNENLCKKCYTIPYNVDDSRCDRLCYSCAQEMTSLRSDGGYNAYEIFLSESSRSLMFSYTGMEEEEVDIHEGFPYAQEFDESSLFALDDSDDTMSLHSIANSDHYGLNTSSTSASTNISPEEAVASLVAPHVTAAGSTFAYKKSTFHDADEEMFLSSARSEKCDLSYLKNVLSSSSTKTSMMSTGSSGR